MSPAARPFTLYGLLLLGTFLLAGLGGYVYAHEPERDALGIDIQATPEPPPESISGSIVAIEGDTVTLATPDGRQVPVTLPSGAPVEDLQRLQEAFPAGATVNVGVEATTFGQVLTGVVWVGAQ